MHIRDPRLAPHVRSRWARVPHVSVACHVIRREQARTAYYVSAVCFIWTGNYYPEWLSGKTMAAAGRGLNRWSKFPLKYKKVSRSEVNTGSDVKKQKRCFVSHPFKQVRRQSESRSCLSGCCPSRRALNAAWFPWFRSCWWVERDETALKVCTLLIVLDVTQTGSHGAYVRGAASTRLVLLLLLLLSRLNVIFTLRITEPDHHMMLLGNDTLTELKRIWTVNQKSL